jgi:hypothetical protein
MEPLFVMIGLFIIGTAIFAYVEFSNKKHNPAH